MVTGWLGKLKLTEKGKGALVSCNMLSNSLNILRPAGALLDKPWDSLDKYEMLFLLVDHLEWTHSSFCGTLRLTDIEPYGPQKANKILWQRNSDTTLH